MAALTNSVVICHLPPPQPSLKQCSVYRSDATRKANGMTEEMARKQIPRFKPQIRCATENHWSDHCLGGWHQVVVCHCAMEQAGEVVPNWTKSATQAFVSWFMSWPNVKSDAITSQVPPVKPQVEKNTGQASQSIATRTNYPHPVTFIVADKHTTVDTHRSGQPMHRSKNQWSTSDYIYRKVIICLPG